MAGDQDLIYRYDVSDKEDGLDLMAKMKTGRQHSAIAKLNDIHLLFIRNNLLLDLGSQHSYSFRK